MGLPEQDAARSWGGRLLVDRDGTEIGTCTQIFVDDATGLPEWAQADLSEGPAVVPLMDASESGGNVRVRVTRSEVTQAPSIGDLGHISPEEEERLYRHYGIAFSQETSESLLPVDEPAEPSTPEPDAPRAVVTEPVTPAPVEPPSLGMLDAPMEDEPSQGGGSRTRSIAAASGGVLAAGAAAVFWWRLRQQVPPTRKELLGARAKAAVLAMTSRSEQARAAAGPLMQRGRRLSAVAAQQANVQARAAAQQASVQARVAAERAAVQARAAAEQAAAVAAAARTVRVQRVAPPAPVVEPASTRTGRDRVLVALQTVAGFAAGYALKARSAGDGRVPARVSDTVRAGKAQVSQRAGAVKSRIASRGDGGPAA